MTQCEIKCALPSDIPCIADLEKLIFSDPWSENQIIDIMQGKVSVFVLSCEGDTVGYAVLDKRIHGEAELFRIAVSPEARGKGYAAALMEKLISDAKDNGCERIYLEVRRSNTPAIRLYGKYGFKADGVRKNYYRFPTEDAVLMSLGLA